MSEKYTNPVMEVIYLEVVSVITTSIEDETPFVPTNYGWNED